MKEITRIHLARTPFNIEIDAKKALEKYLNAIQKTLGADDDTMREIEARIVEILAERSVAGEHVITTGDVEAIEKKLGSPSDFIDETNFEDVGASGEKRLMRNTERGLLGGVCAGIADYFGIDVVWARLTAVLLTFFSFGTAAVVYFVLWLVIPPARTAAEKLQMRGAPVTLAALKSEARGVLDVREGSKPLVIALRVLLGLGCIALAVMAIGFIVIAVLARRPLFSASIHGLMTGGTLATFGGAYVTAIIAGLLFVVLMALAAYASFAWTINKKLLISASIVIVLGLTSFATGIGLGISGSDQINHQLEQRRTTDTVDASKLAKGVKKMTFSGSDELTVEYHVTSGAPRIDVQYLKGQKKAQVMITRDGDQATVTMKLDQTCSGPLVSCSGYNQVTIYGPALSSMAIQSGSVSYYPDTQSKLAVHVADSTGLMIEGGHVDLLTSTIASGGWLSSDDAEITTAQLAMAAGSSSSFGALDTLTITTPRLCNEATADVTYRSVNSLTVNGKQTTHVSDSYPCVTVNQ